MITGRPYEELQEIARTHTCGKCGGRLNVAWVNGEYAVRCQDLTHDTITSHDKEREKQIQIIKESRNLDSKSLMVMPESKMVERVNMARFPQQLTEADKHLLAQAAITYGFDPLMGEITIYQGRPYISIDGRYRKAQETEKLDGVETRPATEQERKDWQIPAGDFFFRAEVFVKTCSRPYVGWGRVRAVETTGGKGFKPVETNPQRMAEKRAEAQALRKAFHIPLPSMEELGMLEEQPSVTVTVEGKQLDTVTGEVQQSTHEQQVSTPATGPAPYKRDFSTIKTAAEMVKALNVDYQMQPKEVLDELNINALLDLSITPAEAYKKVADLKRGAA